MSPTENAQLTEPDTVTLSRVDGAELVDDGTGPMTLAPRIEEAQRLREHFQSLVDEPDDLEGEQAWQARRLVAVLVALALLALTVGVTLIGLGGTDQRRPEQGTAAAVAAAQADAARGQVTAAPAAPTVAAPTPSATATVSPSATASPTASSPSATPSAASPSPSASRSPSPSASSPSTKPSPKPPAPSPSPSAGKPKPAGPACTVSRSTRAQIVGYNATVTLTNKGGKALSGWTSTFSLPTGYFVQTLSGGVWNQSGTTVNVMNGSTLGKGASATVTFTAWGGFGPPSAGTGWTLSGTSCG